jgi:hypothetical protein
MQAKPGGWALIKIVGHLAQNFLVSGVSVQVSGLSDAPS